MSNNLRFFRVIASDEARDLLHQSCIRSPVSGLAANAVSHSPVVKTGALQALFQTHNVIAAILPMRAE
jgi:hypothetical protein